MNTMPTPVTTLEWSRTPHKKMQEALHKKGLVIINWPYGIRPFFKKRPAELTGAEIGKLIRALLHPNPASRVQLISRHHCESIVTFPSL